MGNFASRLATVAGLVALATTTMTISGAAQAPGGTTVPISIAESLPPTFSGATLFDDYCKTCHGVRGTGDGPLAKLLRKQPADLTLLARRNGGVFSPEMVTRIIDGRKPLGGHGGGDMPVWGEAFANTAEGAEATPRKIAALVNYLESIQQR
jgi:mono/diheme cytochrome c family protein